MYACACLLCIWSVCMYMSSSYFTTLHVGSVGFRHSLGTITRKYIAFYDPSRKCYKINAYN